MNEFNDYNNSISKTEGEKTYIDAKFTVGDAKKKKKDKKPGSFIAIALICSLLGGAIGGTSTYAIISNINNKNVTNNTEIVTNTSTTTNNTSAMTIPEIAKKASPAVVGVATKSINRNMFTLQQEELEGIGSGFIFNDEGYILTNYHVIEGASDVKVIFYDGKEVNAKVINYQEDADLAVIKITEEVKLPGILEIGDSDSLQVGEQVVAIGNPLGKEFSGSVTTGIVSALNREVQFDNGKKLKLIQTDTAINPGNSGGPLLNSKGQVIGINTAKIGQQGVEGLGFSIPINEASNKLDNLLKPILKLGISALNLNKEMAKENNMPVGIYIESVESLSVAQKGGLQPGDVIVKFDGKKVSTVEELNQIKSSHKEGDTVSVELVRSGKTVTTNLKLE
ncbi:S1C family serine protease [Clostridium faecium]|uniref:Trypsin-like peptidase domain-containing protein n=1 Tax=Clostridium faecium TaxID=2762223 RepID=A0ABR8YX93_9CLOT|nr:trypsin-like peptidase domain-containing protein [Clostridium faecium]MBD8048906.1 trypsin-like peptidase domain-containing protein [Clostridium faecium]